MTLRCKIFQGNFFVEGIALRVQYDRYYTVPTGFFFLSGSPGLEGGVSTSKLGN